MVYVGIDPSFTRTGVCYFDDDTKVIKFNAVTAEGSNDNYANTLSRSGLILLGIIKNMELNKEVSMIMEEPLITSMVASRLGMLSASIVWGLLYVCPNITEMHTVSPSVISSINRMLQNKNKDLDKKVISKMVVIKILDYLQEIGYKVIILNDKYKKNGEVKPRVISHDEAESFILLLELLKHKKVLPTDVWIKILSINRGLAKQYQVNVLKKKTIKE